MTIDELVTVEEKVDSICKWNLPGLRAAVLEAMQDAIEDEREACAKLAEEMIGARRREKEFRPPGRAFALPLWGAARFCYFRRPFG